MIGYVTKLFDVPDSDYRVHQIVKSIYPEPQQASWVREPDGTVSMFSLEKFNGACFDPSVGFHSMTEIEIPDVGDVVSFYVPFLASKYVGFEEPKNGKRPRGKTSNLLPHEKDLAKQYLIKKMNARGFSVIDVMVDSFGLMEIQRRENVSRVAVFSGAGIGTVTDQSLFINMLLKGIGGDKKTASPYLGYGNLVIR